MVADKYLFHLGGPQSADSRMRSEQGHAGAEGPPLPQQVPGCHDNHTRAVYSGPVSPSIRSGRLPFEEKKVIKRLSEDRSDDSK